MSQEKVDKYKQEKANRKKTMAREKLKKRLYIFLGAVIGIAFIAWIGYSVYLEKKEDEEQSKAMAEYESLLQEYMEQQATATTGTDSETTGSDDATKGTDDATKGSDDTTAGTDNEESSSEEETTTGSEE